MSFSVLEMEQAKRIRALEALLEEAREVLEVVQRETQRDKFEVAGVRALLAKLSARENK